MATAGRSLSGVTASPSRTGRPAGSAAFDWSMTGLSALYLAGLWVDGWAHFHGRVDGSFFTPWHFLFYGSFAIVAVFLLVNHVRNLQKGYAFSRTLPYGYGLSMAGVGVFAFGGVGDMIWHTLFGIEGGTEALMSPTHILLAIGMSLIFTGPLRSAWARFRSQHEPGLGWVALGPAVAAGALFVTLLMFFTSYANPIVTPQAVMLGSRRDMAQDFGVTGILLTTSLLISLPLLLLWRWCVPFGTFTLTFGLSSALLTVLNDAFILIIPALAAGLIVDLLVAWLKPSPARLYAYIAMGAAAPTFYFALYFITLASNSVIRWSVHVWSGSIFIAGMIGGMIALLISAAAREPDAAVDE
ncbi:MAG: hypothetical protein IPK19_34655 [Chloroflexi bacterium]|nr:hypothetical protein [Chloroflexota bacterium]